MRYQDKQDLARYYKKLDLIRSLSNVNPLENEQQQLKSIERAKKDVAYMVGRYFPHYATAACADFQILFANNILKDPTSKAFAQWGRGLAKSVWCDILIPFWLYLNQQASYMVLVGWTHDKAKQLLGDLQAEFEANPQLHKDFGTQKLEGHWQDGSFKTQGCRKHGLAPFIGHGAGIGQSVRGLRVLAQRPDLCVVDDIETTDTVSNPKRQDKYVNWITTALLPTMDGSKRRLLYANNRFAPRMIQTELQALHPTWLVSHVPAYDKASYKPAWPAKYADDYYRKVEEEIGKLSALAEYVQEPHISGKIFTPEQIVWDDMPQLKDFRIIIGYWDVAYAGNSSSDYNAVRIWGLCKNNLFWQVQSFLKQSKMTAAVAYICHVQKTLPEGVLIHWRYESQFWNDELDRTIREVSQQHGVRLYISKVNTPRTKKYDRILSMQPLYQNNRIRYNKQMKGDADTQQGLAQLYGIEPGYNTHDDAPDADQQAIDFLEKHIPSKGGGGFLTGKIKHHNERI